MNSVEKVKYLCKTKKIPISKLERDLGFGNGYIGQLKKGTLPNDRLSLIANYLDVSTDYLMFSESSSGNSKTTDEDIEQLCAHYSLLTSSDKHLIRQLIDSLAEKNTASKPNENIK